MEYTINNTKKVITNATSYAFASSLLLTTSSTPATNALIAGRGTAIHITESATAPHIAQSQESHREAPIVASTEKVLVAFLESEPQYEHLYRRLADI